MSLPIGAPRGKTLQTKGWRQEAALRLLLNAADRQAADEAPDAGAVADALTHLEDGETLLVSGGLPAAVIRCGASAPAAVVSGASWARIGCQLALESAYETFSAVASTRFDGTLAGRLVACGGMDATGGARSLAAVMNGAAFLGVERDAERLKRRMRAGYCEIVVNQLDEAVRILRSAVHAKQAVSVGLTADWKTTEAEMARRGIAPDVLPIDFAETLETACWVALSGEPSDIFAADAALRRLFPDSRAARWVALAARRVRFEGLPARACRLGQDELTRFAEELNRMEKAGELKAPLALGLVRRRAAPNLAPVSPLPGLACLCYGVEHGAAFVDQIAVAG